MTTSKARTRLKKAEQVREDLTAEIDAKIAELEVYLRPYEKIKAEIDKLRAARRALLGGSKLTGAGDDKLRQQDIVEYLKANPGSSPGKIAEHFKVKQPTVSSHLYRGKDDRFLTKDGVWYLREPSQGITTPEDING